MIYYLYTLIAQQYCGKVEQDEPPSNSTEVEPFSLEYEHVYIAWNVSEVRWEYKEMSPDIPRYENFMNAKLTYSQIRALEYPKQEDYLDAIVKSDAAQIEAYVQACLHVKSNWPKDMVPITRREYLIRTIKMIPYVAYEK